MNVLEIVIPVLFLLVLVYLTLEYSILIPPKRGLPVLMYHNISDGKADALNIPVEKLELQLMYLKEKGYTTLSLKDLSALVNQGGVLPKRSIILTFDDAYESIESLLLPLLERFGFNASVFVPVAFIGKSNQWDEGGLKIMNADSLQKISRSRHIEIGLHSFMHKSYNDMDAGDMEEDLRNCRQALEFYKVPYVNALAYPYGAYPRKDLKFKQEMFELFAKTGLDFAFRIGNRINPFPLKSRYEIERTDIRGTDSFFIFKTKLKKGRAKVFA